METSPLSSSTQSRPIIIATSTLDDKAETQTTAKLQFSVSSKKIDKVTEKIYSLNSKRQDAQIANEIETNTPQTEQQIIYLDSSNSTNQTADMTNTTSDNEPRTTQEPSIPILTEPSTHLHMEPSLPTASSCLDAKAAVESKPTNTNKTVRSTPHGENLEPGQLAYIQNTVVISSSRFDLRPQ